MVTRQKIVKTKPKPKPLIIRHTRAQKISPEKKSFNIETNKLPLYTAKDNIAKIALIQTGCWGDNINSTLMFQPIMDHYKKDCLIDVYTSSKYASAFYNNPLINKIIQYPATDKQSALHLTLIIPDYIKNRGYDHIFTPHPMFNPGRWASIKHEELGENLIYAWVNALESAGIECPMPPQSILRLVEAETEKVSNFCKKIPDFKNKRNVLMECHGESGQTFWNDSWTYDIGVHLLQDPNTNLFISCIHTHHHVDALKKEAPGRVYFVGGLSIRECAELFNGCQVFMSVSSGLSNACNTNWCKKDIKWIETVNSHVVTSAPIRKEGKIFWLENDITKFKTMLSENGI